MWCVVCSGCGSPEANLHAAAGSAERYAARARDAAGGVHGRPAAARGLAAQRTGAGARRHRHYRRRNQGHTART